MFGCKRFEIHAEIVVNLKMQDIDAIMVTALEGGINHWCDRVEVVGDFLGKYASEQISRNGALKLYGTVGGEVSELTLEKFCQGFRQYLEDGFHVAVNDNKIDAGDIDANDADCIIQFALFGEVRYS